MSPKDQKSHYTKSIPKMRGIIVSIAMTRTCVVLVKRRVYHSRYKKVLTRTKRFLVDSATYNPKVGNIVEFSATKPISKRKRWRITTLFNQ
jgi:small subunit ribosomal protein S17